MQKRPSAKHILLSAGYTCRPAVSGVNHKLLRSGRLTAYLRQISAGLAVFHKILFRKRAVAVTAPAFAPRVAERVHPAGGVVPGYQNHMAERNVLNWRGTKAGLAQLGLAAAAIALPAACHLLNAPVRALLPMHWPVLLAGLVFGWRGGLAVGLLVPLSSFALSGMDRTRYEDDAQGSATSTQLQDSTLFLRCALATDGETAPLVTALFQLKMPTGKYQNADPAKLGTDITGTGTCRQNRAAAARK